MANITDIIQYYVNLLIVQYHEKPKAQATIRLFAQEMLASGILIDIGNAYNVDTAIGVQLDVIGKYVGVDRYYAFLTLENYFSLITYDETISLPSSPPRFGFSDYTTYSDYSYNGTLDYADIITQNNALFDSDYRVLIKLKIIENNSNYSHAQIDQEIFNLFGLNVRPESAGNMTIQYFVTANITTLIRAILIKNLFPKPMGVLLNVITDVTGDMFALTDYTGYETPYGYGLSSYSDYDTLPGQVLTYSQITEV